MKYLVPVVLFASLFLFQYCKSGKYTPEDYPDAQIMFGSGGGFAGTYNHYYLFENGELFKNSTAKPAFEKVKKVKKSVAKQIFNNYKTFKFQEYQLDDPGNMSYYMEYKNGDNKHKIQWGGNNQKIDPNVQTIYKILTNLTKK